MLVGGVYIIKMFLKLWQNVKDLLSSWLLGYVPDQFKTQEMWNKSVQKFKTQEMWNKSVQSVPWMLKLVPDQYKTQEMCNKAVQRVPWMLKYVPDQYKT